MPLPPCGMLLLQGNWGGPSQSPRFPLGSTALSLPCPGNPMRGSLHEGFQAGGCGVGRIRMGYRGVLHEFWGAEWCHLPLSLPGCLLFPDFRFNPLPGAHGSSSVLDTLKMGIEDSLWGKCGGSSLLLPPCNREQLQDIQAQPFPGKEIQGNCAGAVPSSAPECRPPRPCPALCGEEPQEPNGP